MPIEFYVDHERRTVVAMGRGTLTNDELVNYQRQVWSRPEVVGFDELMDMSSVKEIGGLSTPGVQELADLSAAMDRTDVSTRFAVVAPDDLAFGLARMYGAYRETNSHSTKQVAVFRTRADALRWLGVSSDGLADPSEPRP
jgi:hypothetical protein